MVVGVSRAMRANVSAGKRSWNLVILCTVFTLALSITNVSPIVSGLSWSDPVTIASGESWSDPQIEEGMNGLYVLSYVYPYDRVNLFASNDSGSSWSSFGDPLGGAGYADRKYP